MVLLILVLIQEIEMGQLFYSSQKNVPLLQSICAPDVSGRPLCMALRRTWLSDQIVMVE